MANYRTFMTAAVCAFLLTACNKADSQSEDAEATSGSVLEVQVDGAPAPTGEPNNQSLPGGLTKQQYDQAIAAIIASGQTRE